MVESTAFERLYVKARVAVTNNPGIEQVIVLQTAGGKTHVILNDGIMAGSHDAEEKFLKMLEQSGDTHIPHITALWHNCGTDIPSYHLRSNLVKLDPRNLNTLIFLRDAFEFHTRTIQYTL